MRICFIADSSSIHVKRIVSHFVRKNDEILIISTSPIRSDIEGAEILYLLDPNKDSLNNSYNTDGKDTKRSLIGLIKPYIPVSLRMFAKIARADIRLFSKRTFCAETVQRYDPEVIYSFRSCPEGMLASYCHIKPLLLRTAGPDISKFPSYPGYRQVIRKALRTADVIVTESQWERQLLYDLCGASITPHVIVIGVDTALFRPPVSQSCLRQKYGVPRDAFVVVSNRSLLGHYNGWLVVQALQTIMEHCPQLVLLYANPSPLDVRAKAKVQDIIARFPRILFIEHYVPHAEVPNILGCGDVYISFSSYDGVPNSVLEAMACGLVPVVADLPQLREWIEPGVTGYIVQQFDMQGLAAVLCKLYTHRQALPEMSARCIAAIHRQGVYEQCMEQTRALLQDLIRVKRYTGI
jgi:glycosyltransferase involved in cell wall biosynthesis